MTVSETHPANANVVPRTNETPLEEQKAELNTHGFEMVRVMAQNEAMLAASELLADATTTADRAQGKVRLATQQRSPQEYVGGWREFTDADGKAKLVRVTMLRPDGTNADPSGFAEVRIADQQPFGTVTANPTKLAQNERFVHVKVDSQGRPHVSGKRGGYSFNVDYSNPATMHNDLIAANNVFEEATGALRSFVQPVQAEVVHASSEASTPVAHTSLPAGPATPALPPSY
ncbi:MAG TPA: hypothetical protein VLI54_05700 [Bacillota bacterium]|nr:hypothetical protein [Bacillota bacterium]